MKGISFNCNRFRNVVIIYAHWNPPVESNIVQKVNYFHFSLLSQRRKDDDNFELEQQLSHEELHQLQDGPLPMDWQTTALFMAVLACLIFFLIAAGILVHHMRQWRRMERRLDQGE